MHWYVCLKAITESFTIKPTITVCKVPQKRVQGNEFQNLQIKTGEKAKKGQNI